MKLRNGTALVVFVLLMALTRPAQALDLAAVGVLNLPGQALDPDPAPTEVSHSLGFGFGGLVTLGFGPMVGVQGGLLYVPRSTTFKESSTNTDLSLSTRALQIPLLVRVSPIDMISIGVGGYYSLGLGSVTGKNNVTGAEESESYDAAEISKSDLGLAGSIGLKFPIVPTLSILADARYLFGLKDLAGSDTTTSKARDFQFLVGVNFGL